MTGRSWPRWLAREVAGTVVAAVMVGTALWLFSDVPWLASVALVAGVQVVAELVEATVEGVRRRWFGRGER